MIRFSIFCLAAIIFSSCGVKLPPVEPESAPEEKDLVLDCSPYDEKCDKEDYLYVPRKTSPAKTK